MHTKRKTRNYEANQLKFNINQRRNSVENFPMGAEKNIRTKNFATVRSGKFKVWFGVVQLRQRDLSLCVCVCE